MSELDSKPLIKTKVNSKDTSKKVSRDSSQEPLSKGRSGDSNKNIEIDSSKRRRNMSESSVDSEAYDTADDTELDQEGGILNALKNLQYGTHVALRGKSKHNVLKADKLIKASSNKNLVAALKQERAKAAEIFMSLAEGGINSIDQDIPVFKPFNKRLPPCSSDEFERQLKNIQHNFPRFQGKCSEFLYFLIEIEALKTSYNITDQQLTRLLQNRLAGRLQRYFMIEMKREKNVIKVLNRIGRDYVETVDTVAEIEKCASFKFQFKDVASELTKLKETMALAYPHMSHDGLRQTYIQKVTDIMPPEVRLALVDDFERQRQREELGMSPLSDHEIDAKIIKHCKVLERKHKKQQNPVFIVNAVNEYEDSITSDDSVSVIDYQEDKNDQSLINDFAHSIKLIAESATLKDGNKQPKQFLAGPRDTYYSDFVKEIKEAENIRFFGQKIRRDIQDIQNDNFKLELKMIRDERPINGPIYKFHDNCYLLEDCPIIDYPIFEKTVGFTPKLTSDILRRFAGRCYACGFEKCPRKGVQGDGDNNCIYQNNFDSWYPCEKCLCGFHLNRDCRALVDT